VRILALDTSGGACAAALWRDGTVVAQQSLRIARGHAEALAPMLRATLAAADIEAAALDALAVSTGPGSFTGLRVGLAAAQGMALALDRPLIGITSFAGIAAAVAPAPTAQRPLAVALSSKGAALFVQAFVQPDDPAADPAVVDPDDLAAQLQGIGVADADWRIAGSGAATAAAALRQAGRSAAAVPPDTPDLAAVARLAARRLAADPAAGSAPVQPLYLRRPAVTPERHGGRLR
jgi:tRNA threonylcarbamoyladenosine biosynthesis protein TsaB